MSHIMKIPDEYLPEISDLPGELSQIAEVIEEAYPGMGVPVTLLLAQKFPGQPVYLHNVKALERAVRDDVIRQRYDSGVKIKKLATEALLSTRQVERILANVGGVVVDDRQMKLF